MKAASFQAVLSNQYLYAALHLHPGRPKGRFKRSPLSPGSNDILLLPPSDPNSWTRTGFGPPARGSAPSTSSGVDLQASGLVLVTNHRLGWRTWGNCSLASIRFPFGCALNMLTLATCTNSLARASGRTQQHRSVSLDCSSGNVVSFVPLLSVTHSFQALLTPFKGFSFSFPSRYSCAIGFGMYLGFPRNERNVRQQYPMQPTLDTPNRPS